MTVARRAKSFPIAALLALALTCGPALAQENGDPEPGTGLPAAAPVEPGPGAETAAGGPEDAASEDGEPKEPVAVPDGAPVADGAPDLPDPAGAPPSLTAIGFDHPGAHCRFLAAGGPPEGASEGAADKELTSQKTVHADPATLFFTERRFDGFGTFERGYARVNGLLRELALVSRDKRPDGERRRYQTLEPVPVALELDFTVSGRTKILTLLDGSITVARGENSAPAVTVTGLCGPDAANRSVK